MWIAAAAALLGAAAPARALEGTVMLADGRTLEGAALRPGPAPDRLLLQVGEQRPLEIAAQDLLVVDSGVLSGLAPAPTARLANGDQVNGKITFPGPRQVRIASGWGSLTVPLEWIGALRLQEKSALPEPVARDTLILAADRVEGEIQGVAGGKVAFLLAGKAVPLELARVHAMAFAPRKRAGEEQPGLRLAIDLGGGERLTGRWVGLSRDVLTVRMEWGDTVDIPAASIARLEVKNGKLVYLSDLKPGEVRQVPYLDGAFPHRVDSAVSGRPLRLGGKVYRRGLGVHSRSELTYTLDGSFQTFAATLGVDDGVAGQGSVVFRVFGDEKLLFESPVLRGGDPPRELRLEVKGVILLRLEVDYADNGDAADHANWADARLLRP